MAVDQEELRILVLDECEWWKMSQAHLKMDGVVFI